MSQSRSILYAPRFADLFFGLAGIGSTVLLVFGSSRQVPQAQAGEPAGFPGIALAGAVILIAILSCFVHRFDRKGWDDYMFQVVAQSALIGMVSLLIAGMALDFVLSPWLGVPQSRQMVHGMIPIALTSWTIGYFYLRLRGTGA